MAAPLCPERLPETAIDMDKTMTEHGMTINNRPIVDLRALAGSSPVPGPTWTHQSDDLNVNLVIFTAGDGAAEHVNAELDVLIVGIEGTGSIDVDGESHPCQPGQAIVIPKGARRSTRAVSDRFAYLTCHRRRAGLWPTVQSGPSP